MHPDKLRDHSPNELDPTERLILVAGSYAIPTPNFRVNTLEAAKAYLQWKQTLTGLAIAVSFALFIMISLICVTCFWQARSEEQRNLSTTSQSTSSSGDTQATWQSELHRSLQARDQRMQQMIRVKQFFLR
jgi:hypothetical protein